MAKMFYSLEEAAAKLGKSVDDVKAMADRRELEVFRDRDRILLKAEQVDLLAGGKGEDDIRLADSGELEPISMASSGSGTGMGVDAKEQTGVSIFDLASDGTEEGDPSAVTRVQQSPSILSQDPGKSGSGLLDLTRGDIDETALGLTNLEAAYSGSGSADQSAPGSLPAEAALGGGGLFEGAAADAANAAAMTPAMAAAFAEPYDGPGSGLVGGLMLGSVIALGLTTFGLLVAMTSAAGAGPILNMMGDNFMAVVGGFLGFAVIAGGIGFLIGKKS
jgi:hypothetical protein